MTSKLMHMFVETEAGTIVWIANANLSDDTLNAIKIEHCNIRQVWLEELPIPDVRRESEDYADWWDLTWNRK